MRRKRLSIILLAVLCLSALAHPFRKEDKNTQVPQRIQNIENGLREFNPGVRASNVGIPTPLTLADRMVFYQVPGLSLAVINNNRIEWAKGYGILKAGDPARVTTGSYFEAASTSKLATAVTALHYVQKGALKLDEDVNRYLRSWKIEENEFTKTKKVTLRLLLTHQSGLPATNFPYDDKRGAPTLVQVLKGELPAKNKRAAVEFIPGSRWQYSNLGYVLIQLVLEDVLGKPFDRIVRETLFEPLGMTSSTFTYPLKPGLRAKEAWPHDGQGMAREPLLLPAAMAHGGLLTTPSDLALLTIELISAYQGKSERVLSKDMARQMFHKELDLDPRLMGFPCGEGLGVFLFGEAKDLGFVHPGYNSPGATSWLLGFPELGQGVVIMTNSAKGESLVYELLPAFIFVYGFPMRRQ